MPPLLLISSMIWQQYNPYVEDTMASYIRHYIHPNICSTCILSPYIPVLEEYKKDKGGMIDLHLHLNGTMESDMVWQDMLLHPRDVYKEISESQANPAVKELYSELGVVKSAEDFNKLLCIAIQIRIHLCNYIASSDFQFGKDIHTIEQALSYLNQSASEQNAPNRHPLDFGVAEGSVNPTLFECYMYIRLFQILSNNNDESVAQLFHYYLLILGYANRMLVQQPFMFGFQEFQKYTSNGFREYSERSFNRRFFQLGGNNSDQTRYIEGRFSPKKTLIDNAKYVEKILSGWKKYRKIVEHTDKHIPQLVLVAHFIKQSEPHNYSPLKKKCRFYHLRQSLKQRRDALSAYLKNNSAASKYIVGIDCAASEFDTPPEVFSETFRKLRANGAISHFTYHAGEDFFHILSGLRAIYESIEFLDLRSGDRIGHATAAGISPQIWASNIGSKILIKRGEYLDDLTFAYHIILANGKLQDKIPLLALKIETYAHEIYQESYSVSQIERAWLYRWNDPVEVDRHNPLSDVDRLFLKYHNLDYRAKYDEIVEIDTYDVFYGEELVLLQKMLLNEMHQKSIVIETLPTSNVLIGHHHSYSSYHLYNWYTWYKQGVAMPPIVVGTDDAGVFATNIYNEYCNIYCMLKYDKHLSDSDIMDFISHLDHNAELYKFTKQ
jgi:adenosine deaminase